MKKIFAILGALSAAVAAWAQPSPVAPASQLEVDTGTIHTKFVAPDTLRGTTLRGSAGSLSNVPAVGPLNWTIAPVPPSGFSSFGDAACAATETFVSNQIVQMVTNGLVAAGRNWYFIEEGQYSNKLDAAGNLVANQTNFPSGLNAITAFAHSQGVKIGSYISIGEPGCCPNNPGTAVTNIDRHVRQTIDWGFDGLLIDACNIDYGTNNQVMASIYRRVSDAAWNSYANTGVTALDAYPWAASTNRGLMIVATANSGRTNIVPAELLFECSVFGIGAAVSRAQNTPAWMSAQLHVSDSFGWAVGPGHWQDSPYALTLNSGPTHDPTVQSLSVNAMISAHNRWTGYNFNTFDVALLENQEVLAIEQGVFPVKFAYSNNLVELFQKPVGAKVSQTNDVLLLNWATTNQTVTVYATNLGLSALRTYKVRDPFQHTTLTNFAGSFSVTVSATNTYLLRLSPRDLVCTTLPLASGFPANYSSIQNSNGTLYPVVNSAAGDGWTTGSALNTAGFDPVQVAGLAARYILNNNPQPAGTYINAIEDESALNIPLNLCGVTDWAPTYTNNPALLNGKGWVQFNGTNTLLTNTLTLQQPFTVFAVLTQPTNDTVTHNVAVIGGTNDTWIGSIFDATDKRVFVSGGGSGTTYSYPLQSTINQNFYVLETVVNGASTAIKTNNVDAKAGTQNGGTAGGGLTNLMMGTLLDPTYNGYGQFKVAAMLIYSNHVLSATEETNVYNWLNARFSVH